MDKYTILLIRACKSKDPEKRLYSYYRRFYTRCVIKSVVIGVILEKLIKICDEYGIVSHERLWAALDRDMMHCKMLNQQYDLAQSSFNFYLSAIRLSDITVFMLDGFIHGLKWRKKYATNTASSDL